MSQILQWDFDSISKSVLPEVAPADLPTAFASHEEYRDFFAPLVCS